MNWIAFGSPDYVAASALRENADPVRPQIAHARAFVAKNVR
jgi:hypothetical protein